MLKRTVLPAIAATLIALAMIQPDWLTRSLSDRVLTSVDTDQPIVALTIDDGPDPATTPAILEVLAEHQAHATFFLISERIVGNEALVQRIVDDGHELANHMTREEPTILLGDDSFGTELQTAHQVLSQFADLHWLRPGSGWFNEHMLSTAESQGYKVVLGSVYPFDAAIPSTWFATEFILWRVRPGAVIVLHDHRSRGERTAATLSRVLPELAARGYRVVTLSELVAVSE